MDNQLLSLFIYIYVPDITMYYFYSVSGTAWLLLVQGKPLLSLYKYSYTSVTPDVYDVMPDVSDVMRDVMPDVMDDVSM